MPETITVAPYENAIVAICQVVLEAMRGQSEEQRRQMWQWYIEDVKAWRAFWGIDSTPK